MGAQRESSFTRMEDEAMSVSMTAAICFSKHGGKKVEERFGQPLRFEPKLISGNQRSEPQCEWTLQSYSAIKVERVSWIFKNYLALGKPTALVVEPGE